MMIRFILLVEKALHQIIRFHKQTHTADDFKKQALRIIKVILCMPHMRPKPVLLHQKIFGTIGEVLIIGKLERCTVILEDATVHMSKHLARHAKGDTHFKQQVANGQECVKTHTECRVFGLGGREGDLGMKLCLPEQGNIAQCDQESTARLAADALVSGSRWYKPA